LKLRCGGAFFVRLKESKYACELFSFGCKLYFSILAFENSFGGLAVR
jgi:hypothetical protein